MSAAKEAGIAVPEFFLSDNAKLLVMRRFDCDERLNPLALKTWLFQVLAASGKPHHPIVSHSGLNEDRGPGTVFEITAEELAAADAYEVADYQRVGVVLASGDEAWMYVQAAQSR